MAHPHPSFEWLRSQTIDSLNITISEYQHRNTGAQHIHIEADNRENVFLVALRTIPEDSTGVAHILEHTALCGSEKYPVRDPFFMMIRRSLNTFMNAMTSSDWTAYPFASENRKDFDNLLGVYLDAVFFSRLDPLDFAQEGHRLDFQDSGNADSPLMYKGVVYNEMKGAMSSVNSQLWQRLSEHIYPTSTYHYNSGGEPRDIPKLSYDELVQFYNTHYHPSNATFMTFGDIPAHDHQEKFESLALHRFERLNKTINVHPEARFTEPQTIVKSYAYTPTGEDDDKQTHVVMGWLLDKSIDLEANLEAHLLSSLLYDNSASPMQHLLETSTLGTSPSPLCGMDDSQYEMLLMCGLQGCREDATESIEKSILERLQTLVQEGIPQEQVEASLHQLELQQREIGGDGYPYGLQLLMSALAPATHRGDILAFMDLETALDNLREKITHADYIPSLIQRLLIDNTHRVTLTLTPDNTIAQREQDEEDAELVNIKNTMTDADKQAIIDQAIALEQRQQQEENIDILPKVGLEDIPDATPLKQAIEETVAEAHHLHTYSAGTNGLVYQQIILPLPDLSPEELHVLPYYTLCLTEMGIGDDSYLSVQQRQATIVGSIHSYYSLRNHVDNPEQHHAYMTVTAKALNRNQNAMNALINDTLCKVNFNDANRIKELIAQDKTGREQSVIGNGHIYAMQAAAANINPVAHTIHQLMGLASVKNIKACYQKTLDDNAQSLIQQLQNVHQKILGARMQAVLITEEQQRETHQDTVRQTLEQIAKDTPDNINSALTLPQNTSATIKQAWITQAPVHFCAQVYPTVSMNHPDAATLTVLGGVLRNGFLHRTIREQGGAYGGVASQDSNSACFRFYSYRDPRMQETLNDFNHAIEWLLNEDINQTQIEESILGVISSLDKPGSPAGEAKQSFHAQFTGRDDAIRIQFRKRVLATTADDLKRVANTWLRAENANIAVVTGKHGEDEARSLGLDIITL